MSVKAAHSNIFKIGGGPKPLALTAAFIGRGGPLACDFAGGHALATVAVSRNQMRRDVESDAAKGFRVCAGVEMRYSRGPRRVRGDGPRRRRIDAALCAWRSTRVRDALSAPSRRPLSLPVAAHSPSRGRERPLSGGLEQGHRQPGAV